MPKHHPRIAAYGDVDELNSLVGVIRAVNQESVKEAWIEETLKKIQNDLFDLGALLASPDRKRLEGKATGFIRKEDVAFLEQAIDRLDAELPPLRSFVLPGGSRLASLTHWARTVCRRAERGIVSLKEGSGAAVDGEILCYINRLSDFLFVLARWINLKGRIQESLWQKK